MAKTRTGKKILSLLLTLCMALSLMPVMGITASAATGDSWVGSVSFDSADKSAGSAAQGWTWDGTSKTLTLSGVNVTTYQTTTQEAPWGTVFINTAINLAGDAKIVLEGANKIAFSSDAADTILYGIQAGDLQIEGSGTLEIDLTTTGESLFSTGISSAGTLILNSGYLKVTGGSGIEGSDVFVNGGYIETTSNGESNGIGTLNYTQNGGVVKATGDATVGLQADIAVIEGGYLESSGIHCDTSFTNNDGVVKTVAVGEGSNGISATWDSDEDAYVGTVTFNGGVTIAKATGDALKAIAAGTVSGSALYWTTVDGTVSGDGKELNDTTTHVTSFDNKYVVIAKSATSTYSTATELNGAYICGNYSEPVYHYAWEPSASASVTGGSYVENLGTNAVILAPGIGTNNQMTVSGTLVAETSRNATVLYNGNTNVTVESGGTLFAQNKSIGAGASYIGNFTNNGGNLILEANKFWALYATGTLSQTGGYTCGISDERDGITAASGFNVSGGYMTALLTNKDSTNRVALNANNCSSFSVSGTGVVSAVTKSLKGFMITSNTVPRVTATGATEEFGALTSASFDATDKTFKVSGTTAPVVCLKTPPPPPEGTFVDSFGTSIANDDVLSYVSGETAHATKGYTFAGWYDNAAYTGDAVTSGFVSSITYYAKWTKGDKTVRTTPLDLTPYSEIYTAGIGAANTQGATMEDDVFTNTAEGWSWNATTKALTLTNATIDCSGVPGVYNEGTDKEVQALTLPNSSTIDLTGINAVTSGNISNRDSAASYGIFCSYALTVTGTGSLRSEAGTATSEEDFASSFGIRLGTLTMNGSATVEALGNDASGAYNESAVSCGFGYLGASTSINVIGGTLTATGKSATGYESTSVSCGIFGSLTATGGNITASGNTKAIYTGYGTALTAEGATIKAGENSEGTATTYTDQKWLNVSFGPAATVGDVTITGTAGTALTSTPTTTITLTNDTFKAAIEADTDVSAWFTNLNGLTAKVTTAAAAGDSTITVAFSGTPTVASGAAIAITIPKAVLTSNEDLPVTVNYAAKFAIKPAAPAANEGYTIDYAAETIAVTSGYEVSVDDSFATLLTSGGIVTPGATYYVRKAAADPILAGAAASFTVAARPAAPEALTADNVKSKTDTTIVLKGTFDKQQYACRIASDTTSALSWQNGTSSDLTFSGLTAGTAYNLYTRVKATGTTPASLSSAEQSVTTKTAAVTAPDTISITPHATYINFSVLNTCEYIITTTEPAPLDWTNSYKPETSGTFDFNAMIGNNADLGQNESLTSGTQYYLHYRVKGTDTAMPSATQTTMFYTLPQKPVANEGYTFDCAAEKMTIETGYEVSTNATNFTSPMTGTVVFTAGANYHIRKVAGTVASEAFQFTAPTRLATPASSSFTVDYTGEKLTGYDATMQYSTDGGITYVQTVNLAQSITSIIPAAGASELTLNVRQMATADNPASEALEITIAKRPTTPAAPTIGTVANKPTENSITLTAVDGCDYKCGDGAWQDSNVFTDLEDAASYTFYQRVKATSTVPASDASAGAAFYTAYATPTAAAYSINAADNKLTINDTTNYEVNTSLGFDSSTNVPSGTELTLGTTYYIRHKADTTNHIPASAALAFSCSKAELSNFAITGTKGTAITPVDGVKITLTGTTFTGTAFSVGTEFDTNVAGLKATITGKTKEDDKDVAIVIISGTPAETKDAGLTITIPGEALANNVEITSVANDKATVKIATDKPIKRENPADFTAGTISYKDVYGTVKSDVPTNAYITDSGEGWAWYAAASTDYDNTKAITAENHPAKTLILSGVNIETSSALALNLPADTTIVLKAGTINNVKSTYSGGDSFTAGVTCASALTIVGSGTLNATGGTATGVHDSMGVHGSTGLTINGGVVNGTGGASAQNSAGISADTGVLTINGGTVTGQGGTSSSTASDEGSVGLYADGNINVTGGSATGNADLEDTELSIGIFSGENQISISGGSVTGSGNTAAIAAVTGITFPTTFAINTPSGGVVREIPDSLITVIAGEAPATSVTIGVKPSSGGGGSAPAPKVPVIVDGQEYNIGTAKTESGVTTVTVDQTALQKQLDAASENVVIPVTAGSNADTVTAKLVVANVDEMAEKEMTLSVQVDNVSYDMPAVAVDTKTLMTELGASEPSDVPVNVTITVLSEDDVTLENGELLLPPVSFTVTAGYSGKSVEVEVFEKYVQRVIEVPDGVDASKITTGVVVENGKQRHVPTEVFQKDGKWYARINSLTNSTYALIHSEVNFTDDDGKWFEAVVTEMASRGVINGRSEGIFDGNANITRTEFAAILVRALGLPENGDASAFTDVAESAWYYGAVGKAYEYGLINGRSESIFDPDVNITRQEAMAMVHRAAAITEFAGTAGSLAAFSDADSIQEWALNDAQWNVGSGLIQGNSAGKICGKENITRGETATIILRLLQKSELVDVRTNA